MATCTVIIGREGLKSAFLADSIAGFAMESTVATPLSLFYCMNCNQLTSWTITFTDDS